MLTVMEVEKAIVVSSSPDHVHFMVKEPALGCVVSH